MGNTATAITDKAQSTKTCTTLNEGTSPTNPHDSAPQTKRALRAHEDSIYML